MKKKIPGNQQKVTDEEIEQALIQANGQPTKCAEILDVDYTTIWRRIRDNPHLEDVKQAYRGRTFQHINSMSSIAVMSGVIKQPRSHPETGVVERDDEGKVIYDEIAVSINQRMHHGNLLMNMYKGDEGIKDQLELTTPNQVDMTKLDDDTLQKLALAGVKKD